MLVLLLLIDSLVLLGVFRGLSDPRSTLSPRVRALLAIMALFFVALASFWAECGRWTPLVVAAAAAIGSSGFRGDVFARLSDAMGPSRFPLYLLSVATLAGMLFLFVPIAIFLTSPGELSVHLEYLFEVNLRDAIVVLYLAAALYAAVPSPRMKTALALLSVGSLVTATLYAFALPLGYPQMTGLMFEQIPIGDLSRALRLLVDLVAVAAAGFSTEWLVRRLGGKKLVVATALLFASLVVAGGISATRERVGERGGSDGESGAPDRPIRFSRAGPNVLILFLDRFMGGFVEPILRQEPALVDRLSGFTWYPRTVSAGENSIAGVHPMLGGYDYLPVEMNARGERLVDLSVEAFSILPLNFAAKGFGVSLINPGGLGFTMQGDCDFLNIADVTCTHIPPTVAHKRAEELSFPVRKISESSYADLLVMLASMRAGPYLLKEVVRAKGPWRPFMDHSAGTTFRVWAELAALSELSSTLEERPHLNIVSNLLPHEPYFLGEDCLPREQIPEPSMEVIRRRGHVSFFSLQHEVAARCALKLVADYLDFLKSEGVYDTTKIVIVSDHGIVGPVEDRSSRAVAGGTVANPFVRTRSVLLVKEIGATGPLAVSEEFLPNAEVPRIVCEEIGGCVNPFLGNRTIEAHGREDPFFVSIVPWQFTAQKPDAFDVKAQLVLSGKDPYDAKGWAMVKQ
jgi:hypothetical protein